MVQYKSIEEFRNTGLLLIINSILHIFGWAITVEVDDDGKAIEGSVRFARVKFRGFDEKSTDEAYKRIANYLKDNASELAEEADIDISKLRPGHTNTSYQNKS